MHQIWNQGNVTKYMISIRTDFDAQIYHSVQARSADSFLSTFHLFFLTYPHASSSTQPVSLNLHTLILMPLLPHNLSHWIFILKMKKLHQFLILMPLLPHNLSHWIFMLKMKKLHHFRTGVKKFVGKMRIILVKARKWNPESTIQKAVNYWK